MLASDGTQTPADGSFATATATYLYDPGDVALVGQPLEIRLLSNGLANGDVNFDNVQLTVALGNPVAAPGGPYTVPIGGSLSLDGGASLPSDGQAITLYEWDLDNDTTYDVTGSSPAAITYADLQSTYGMTVGANTITLRVTDDSSPTPKTATATGTVTLAAPLAGQLGVLNLENANGGINPATGAAWVAGDQYRLAFYTDDKRNAESDDIEDYNAFVQGVAEGSTAYSTLGKTTWKAMGSTFTVSARENTGSTNLTAGEGAPVFVMDGETIIAVDNADMWNGWTSGGTNTRLPGPVVYAPYLDENASGDTGSNHGENVATGSNSNGTIGGDPLGDTDAGDPNGNGLRLNYGSSNANNSARVWARFGNGNPSLNWSFYAISHPLTIVDLAETTALSVTSFTDDKTGADVLLGLENIIYTVTFDEAVNISTLDVADFGNTNGATAAITVDQVSPTFDPAVFEVTVTPTSVGTLQFGILAAADVEDLAGNSMDTVSAIGDDTTITIIEDITAPTLTSIVDDRAGANLLVGTDSIVYSVTFSEAMDASTAESVDFENRGTATLSIDSVVTTADPAVFEVTVTPTTAGTAVLQIAGGADLKDLVGNSVETNSPLPDDTSITIDPDTTAPVVDTLSPANGATEVGLTPTLTINFVEASFITADTGNITIFDAADDSALQVYSVTDPEVTITGPNEVTVALSSIPFSTSAYVQIDAGAFQDASGNDFAGITDKTTWTFSVIGLPTADGPLSVFTATEAGETIPFGPTELLHNFDTFNRLSAEHVPATPSDIQMSAGHHLVIYNSRIDSSSGSANRTEVQSKLSLAGTDLAAGWSQGYIRRQETQDETITAGGSIIDVANAGDLLQLRTFRTDSTASEAAIREPGSTGIQLLKLDDAWDYLSLAGHDGSGTNQVLPADNSTWSPVTYSQELEKDTGSFEYLSGIGVTLKTAGHYLVCANSYNSGANERSAVIQRLTLDGNQIDGSVTTVYLRGPAGNSSQEGATSIGMIIETNGANQVLNVELRQSDNDGTITVLGQRTALTIAKLPDTAEYIRLSDLTGGQNVNAVGAVSYDDDPASQLEVDTAFSHSATTDPSQIGVTTTGDFLFLGSFFVASDNASRGFPNLGWQVNGSGGIAAYGQTGRYSRNLGPPELGNWSGFMTGLTASDYVETLTTPLGNGGSNPATALAMQGVSIDSLFSITPPANPYDTWAAGPFLGTLTDPTADLDFDGGGLDTGIEWVVGGDPTDPSDDAGLAPTIDNTTNAGFLTFTYEEADAAVADPNTSIAVQYGSDLSGWNDAVADGTNVIISETENGVVDTVEVQLLRSAFEVDGKLFARLKVVVTTP